ATIRLTLFVIMPNLLVAVTSLLTRDSVATVCLPINIDNYARTLDLLYLQVLWDSLRMSSMAMLVCLIIRYPFAMCIAQLPGRWQAVVLFLVSLPFWSNSLVRTYALQFILGNQAIINK